MTMQGPILSRDDRAMQGGSSFDQRTSFERKLSELAGYMMLILSVSILSYGIFWVFS
jgi:hypothetical protein